MQENNLKDILAELYLLDPELRAHESELIKLIVQLKEIKPDTKFDRQFALDLKDKILNKKAEQIKDNKAISFNFMNKKIYWAALSVATLCLVVFVFTRNAPESPRGSVANEAGKNIPEEVVTKLAAGAFGSLSGLGVNAEATGAMGLGGFSNEKAVSSPEIGQAVSDASVSRTSLAAGGDAKMILPYYGFKYVYRGDPIELTADTAPVYRRLKGDRTLAKSLVGSFSSASSLGFNLTTLSDLRITNLTLTEDRDLGLMITFDFNDDNIFVSENWQKWRNLERDACGSDQACWEKYRIRIEDVPADGELTAISDKFLAQHGINLDNYGPAQVDNSWRANYETFANKNDFYVPEYASVIYPLLIEGKPARNQSGGYAGIYVSVNLFKKAASGLSGLTPYRYESSNYELETSATEIIELAESGGWNKNYYASSEDLKTIELGTPEKAYVQIFRYQDGFSEELFVPALVFPVTSMPEGGFYYGNRYVIVPLAKDMIREINNQPQPLFRTMEDGRGGTSVSSPAEPAIEIVAPVTPDIMPLR